jgi:hypothetical protein
MIYIIKGKITYTSLIFICFLISCYNNKKDKTNRENENQYFEFFGETKWLCCSIEKNRCITNYNICTEVIFEKNNLGRIINPDGNEIEFKWKSSDTILTILSIDSTIQTILENDNYKLFKSEKSNSITLESNESKVKLYFTKK